MSTGPTPSAPFKPGVIPCPCCGHPIALHIELILAGALIQCTACETELTIDENASKKSLLKLQSWYADIQALQNSVPESDANPSKTAPLRRRTRRSRN